MPTMAQYRGPPLPPPPPPPPCVMPATGSLSSSQRIPPTLRQPPTTMSLGHLTPTRAVGAAAGAAADWSARAQARAAATAASADSRYARGTAAGGSAKASVSLMSAAEDAQARAPRPRPAVCSPADTAVTSAASRPPPAPRTARRAHALVESTLARCTRDTPRSSMVKSSEQARAPTGWLRSVGCLPSFCLTPTHTSKTAPCHASKAHILVQRRSVIMKRGRTRCSVRVRCVLTSARTQHSPPPARCVRVLNERRCPVCHTRNGVPFGTMISAHRTSKPRPCIMALLRAAASASARARPRQ